MNSVRRDARAHRDLRSLAFLASLLVRGSVKGDEENEVGAESRATGEGRKLLPFARSDMRERGKELVNIIIVRGVVHKSCLPHQPRPWTRMERKRKRAKKENPGGGTDQGQ